MSSEPATTLAGVPLAVDMETPNPARMYDYYLGGSHNFAADRELAETVISIAPWTTALCRLNRSFLRRAVLFMLDQGVRQFLDLGSGIPTVGNVHEVAQRQDPDARVVYVDREPVAIAMSAELLEDNHNAAMVGADISSANAIFSDAETTRLIDFTKPVGLLMVGVLLFVPDEDDPAGLVATFRDACKGGGYLAISHLSQDEAKEQTRSELAAVVEQYKRASDQLYVRDRSTIRDWFTGTELVDPRLVPLGSWRPEHPLPSHGDPLSSHQGHLRAVTSADTLGYAGVARIPPAPKRIGTKRAERAALVASSIASIRASEG